jgi:hypothetical protein|tara:strand:+ start:405 stop:530 length:126 start_codon:yes stop_codon:yes gene_type:complete
MDINRLKAILTLGEIFFEISLINWGQITAESKDGVIGATAL